MSNNPFSELPNTNPYAPPGLHVGSGSPANPLLIPAIALLILSSFFVLCIVLSIPVQIVRIRAIDTATSHGVGEMFGSVLSLILWPLMNVGIALGAISMIGLKSYRSARQAAIMSAIPVCSPWFLLGIPFGIWAIVVLNRPAVKQRFMKQ
jgi:hypothetical protein